MVSVVVLYSRAGSGDRIYLENGEVLRGEVTVLENGTVEVLRPDGIEGTITFSPDEVASIEYGVPEPQVDLPAVPEAEGMLAALERDTTLASALEDSSILKKLANPPGKGIDALLKPLGKSKEMLYEARKVEAYAMLRSIKMAQTIYFMEHAQYATCSDAQKIASVLSVDTSQGKYFDYSTTGDRTAYVITAVVRPEAAERGELPKGGKIVYSSRTQGYIEAGWSRPAPEEAGTEGDEGG